jgi:hypothetical protein
VEESIRDVVGDPATGKRPWRKWTHPVAKVVDGYLRPEQLAWLNVVRFRFVHPGFEYRRAEYVGGRRTRAGVMEWKPGKSMHDRKFMLTWGSLLDWSDGRDHRLVPLVFWGEWEGPSVFWRVESPGKPLPSIVHAPFRPSERPAEPVQNTDPMVFGDAFVYSNCLQGAYRSLRYLSRGSIVLFGRYASVVGRPSFSLDTCLVIDRVESLAPVPMDDEKWGVDLLRDAVLCPLHTEGADEPLSVYLGQTPADVRKGSFSFFPACLVRGSLALFARPELHPTGALRGVISPTKPQGIKVTSGLGVTERDAIWAEVVKQVTSQGCGLGYHASAPPVLEVHAAESAARRSPMPLI